MRYVLTRQMLTPSIPVSPGLGGKYTTILMYGTHTCGEVSFAQSKKIVF